MFRFRYHGTLCEPTFQNATPLTNRSRKVSNFSQFPLQWSTYGIFEILNFEILTISGIRFRYHGTQWE